MSPHHCCWAMGLTQHRNSVATIEEVMNFLFLKGNIGRPCSGACPVRGHSNVQGDRTMGICERMGQSFLDDLGREFCFEPPRQDGLDTVKTIKAMHDGRIRFFLGLGGNFLSASPDTEFTAAALQSCELTAHISTKLNRSHLITGRTAHPALSGPLGNRHSGGRGAISDPRKQHGHRESIGRPRQTSVRAFACWQSSREWRRPRSEIGLPWTGTAWSETMLAFATQSPG